MSNLVAMTFEEASRWIASLEAENARLRGILQTIQGWDCLNPPRADLLGDLPWLRKLVDEGLSPNSGAQHE